MYSPKFTLFNLQLSNSPNINAKLSLVFNYTKVLKINEIRKYLWLNIVYNILIHN